METERLILAQSLQKFIIFKKIFVQICFSEKCFSGHVECSLDKLAEKNCSKYYSFVAQNPEKRLRLSDFSVKVFKTIIGTRIKRF